MKKLIYTSALLTSLFLVSCGGNDTKKTDGTATDKPAASAAVNEADWELKELGTGTTDSVIPHFAVKLPKDAVIEKDPTFENTLVVTFKNKYKMSISYASVMLKPEAGMKGQIEWQKDLNVTSNMSMSDMKMLAEDSTGFAYTSQAKDGGKLIGEVTGHFVYFIADKKGGYIRIQDLPNDLINEEAEAVASAENTKKIRSIVMSSATFK